MAGLDGATACRPRFEHENVGQPGSPLIAEEEY